MKRVSAFALLMIGIIILLPLLIVKGCGGKPEEIPPEKVEGTKIKVYITAQNEVREMLFEEYLKGVVAAEMPAEFELEALKAQAVAARTYAYARMGTGDSANAEAHQGAAICTDSTHCMAWVSKQEAMKKWSIFAQGKYWSKIERAVSETTGLILTYNGAVANPVFHSNSGGKTENTEDVWAGPAVPYLRSVVSEGEEISPSYSNTVTLTVSEFCDKISAKVPDFKINQKDIMSEIKIIEFTEGKRVKSIKIGNHTFKGTEVRSLFSLKSANFTIEQLENDSLQITTLGNGHGVGMSQWGANNLAKNGAVFDEILKYYYTGITLETMDQYEESLAEPSVKP